MSTIYKTKYSFAFAKKLIALVLSLSILTPGIYGQVPDCVECCCGNVTEPGIPCGDFQEPPFADPSGWIDYSAGDTYCGWTVTSGTVSIHGPLHNNLGAGNPNGASQHLDLNGSTPGSISTNLTGLTPGYKYTIVLWYAKHNGTSVANANIKVESGAWLDETWSATNTGSSIWLQKCFSFIAQASTTTLEFIGSSSVPCCGMLIDDLTMYECPNDAEVPIFSDTPDPLIEVECSSEIPAAQVLTASDNCDTQVQVNFSETQQGPPCNLIITRSWTATDECDNTASLEQKVMVSDKTPPQFTVLPQDMVVSCDDDVLNEFYNWLGTSGGAAASDNCSAVTWSTNYNKDPDLPCEEIIVSFTATDLCGNNVSANAKFSVVDVGVPVFTKLPENIELNCEPNALDQLKDWLTNHGYSTASDNCSQIVWSDDFDGDYNKTEFEVSFTAKDLCGNGLSKKATFKINESSKSTFIYKNTCDSAKAGIRDTTIYSSGSCDSLVIVEWVLVKSDTTLISGITCKINEAIIDTTFLQNQNGCDSLIIKNIAYIKPDTSYSVFNICGLQTEYNDTLHLMGQICDSTVIIQYKSLPVHVISIQNTTCDSSQAGTQIFSLKNQFGCDSIVTVTTSLSEAIYTFLTEHLCGTSQNFTDTLTYTTATCDSLVVTQHIFHPADTSYSEAVSCEKSQSGVFINSYQNVWGCDSVHILTVSYIPVDTSYIAGKTCFADQAGIFIDTFTNQHGCDSLIIKTITYIPADTSYVSEFTCDPSMAGTFVKIFPSTPCDSVVIITRTLTQNYIVHISNTSCISSQAGIDTLKLISTQGCDSLIITETIYQGFEADVLVKDESCAGFQDGMITITNVKNATPPVYYSIDTLNWLSDSVFTGLAPGEYSVHVKDAGGCELDFAGQLIQNGDNFTIDLGPDFSVKQGKRAFLDLSSSSPPAEIVWSLDSLNDCSICHKVDFLPSSSISIAATAVSKTGCIATDSIYITLLPDVRIFVPSAFSPDLNGVNDRWIIYGDNHLVNIRELQIFDRWGERVFAGENIQPGDASRGWDGKLKGHVMQPAVFVFWAKLEFDDGRTQFIKGDINLIK